MVKRGYRLILYDSSVNYNAKNYLVTGFPGFGAVGYLATKYLVDKLHLQRVGYIDTPIIPDFTSLEDYGLSLPHEIFYGEINNKSVIVILNRINPLKSYLNSYVKSVLKLISTYKIKEAFLIGGMDSRFREGKEEYRWLKTSHSSRTLDAPLFMRGPYII
ncbi:MAG TPA: hypothetical protein ENF93_01510, partial [Ignisphaera sp.]|nr:hypothetical protein [Ignisphaera sp.]